MTDTTHPRSGSKLTAIALFVAGLVIGALLISVLRPAPKAPEPALSGPMFGAAQPAAPASAGEIQLYRDINDKFVEQLRRYGIRLNEIAAVAEAEGAASAAGQMKDFALETDLLVDRYDLISKQQ